MELEKAALVLCITLFFVIGINALIYLSVTRGNVTGSIELFRRASERVRDPWKSEDDDLKELSSLVGELQKERAKHRAISDQNGEKIKETDVR
jgi:hypothetical protein